jgi:GNAT superfamily N-acetyltransferase
VPQAPRLTAALVTGMRARVEIRRWAEGDDDALWEILAPIVRAGETYTLPRDLGRAEAIAYWRGDGHETFVADEGGAIVGTYFLCANQRGGGAHVANAGYATRSDATGRGVARAMCAHSLARARERGFRAMQFNFVVATNEAGVRAWQRAGFAIVGRLPGVFAHPRLGDVDALVMHRWL